MAFGGLFVIVLALIFSDANSKSFPSYVTICHRSNKDEFVKCGLQNTFDIQPHIGNGIPELSLPPLEPLNIPQIKLEQGTSAVNYKLVMNNVKLHGLSQFKFLEFDAEMEGNYFAKGKVSLPQLYLEADYEIDGKVLLLPIKGKGAYRGNFTNTVADLDMTADLVDKNGKQYVTVKDMSVKLSVENSVGNFENLFSGDAALSTATNSFLNENSKDIQKETLPAIEEVVTALVKQIVNKVFEAAPYDDLFPK